MPGRRSGLGLGALIGLSAVATVALAIFFASSDPNDDPLPTSGRFDGREFVAAEVIGRKLLPGSELRLSFDEGRVWFYSGCNSTTGGYQVRSGRLELVRATETMAGCEGEAQDDWVNDVIDGADVSEHAGKLTLRSDHRRITFVPALDPDRRDAVVGQNWKPVRYSRDGRPSRLVSRRARREAGPWLRVSDQLAHLGTPCGYIALAVDHQEDAIVFGPVQRLRRLDRGCTAQQARDERAMRAILSGRVKVRRRGDQLVMRRGGAMLSLKRSAR